MNTELNKNQQKVLKDIISARKVETKGFNANTLRAFTNRDFVKITENKKGKFVQATAKGKKAVN